MRTANLVNIIFGMKVRQARREKELSLSEFAAKADLSPSYVTEIEKGRKYPKADKIINMAHALDKDYDDLVSIKLGPSLAYLETLLSSPLLQQFPFEEFDLETSDLINLFTRAPDKASALLHTILEIGRQYNMKEEHFLRAALRSYQEIHENYFQDLEDAAAKFAKKHDLDREFPIKLETLQEIISKDYGYTLDSTKLNKQEILSGYRSVFIEGTHPKLLLNASLRSRQIKFILARELGYQFLKIKNRAYTSAPDKVASFEQVLNDFKASYFAGALMMPRVSMLADLQEFFQLTTWDSDFLWGLLTKYHVTPEMLLYRFSELIPQFFGLKLHFLRFHNIGNEYHLVKQLNMNNLLLPHGINMRENHCRRWLALRLLRGMADVESTSDDPDTPLVGTQVSEFLNSQERFLSFGFARPLSLSPHVGSSAVIGFRINSDLTNTIKFVQDPTLPVTIINDTCERCPLDDNQCAVRAAQPTILEQEKYVAKQKRALKKLMAQLQR